MTRREKEILIASVSWTDKTSTVNEEKAFQAGARWSDKTMIDKACKWIDDNVENAFVCVNDTMTELNGIELSRCIRKAMEE